MNDMLFHETRTRNKVKAADEGERQKKGIVSGWVKLRVMYALEELA
jgi:hypothetical protein